MTNRHRKTGSFEVAKVTGSGEALDRLFVYGTLRSGQTARSVVANSVTRCEPATVAGSLYIFPMGYPAYAQGEGVVLGEVLWLNDLAATFAMLDAYEGTDFARVITKVRLVPDNAGVAPMEIWTWIYTLADPQTISMAQRLPHGDWVKYWRENVDL
jgi:gamma-glutamylcyclotransferase (GGCT)/AIG2-like uncharacterized protein YtfP